MQLACGAVLSVKPSAESIRCDDFHLVSVTHTEPSLEWSGAGESQLTERTHTNSEGCHLCLTTRSRGQQENSIVPRI